MSHKAEAAAKLNWQVVKLKGNSTHEYFEQIEAMGPMLTSGWQTRPSETTGNPTPVRPTVLVIYREDHEFSLDPVIPKQGVPSGQYDFVLASQPWRARTSAAFKAKKILAPLARSLRAGGKLLTIQSYGDDPGMEIVQRVWPGEKPFPVGRHELVDALKAELSQDPGGFTFVDPPDDAAVFRYEMHTLPSEIGDRIGTSTLFAAWNAAIYVNQIEDERLEKVVTMATPGKGSYLDVTQDVLHKYGGLWFKDEAFLVTRNS
jgi:hypothetical protein